MSGVDRIVAERKRQIEQENFAPEQDAAYPGYGDELAYAGMCYAGVNKAITQGIDVRQPPPIWPWSASWWKPSTDNPIRNLEKAGALIAASIDWHEAHQH